MVLESVDLACGCLEGADPCVLGHMVHSRLAAAVLSPRGMQSRWQGEEGSAVPGALSFLGDTARRGECCLWN